MLVGRNSIIAVLLADAWRAFSMFEGAPLLNWNAVEMNNSVCLAYRKTGFELYLLRLWGEVAQFWQKRCRALKKLVKTRFST